MTSSLANPGGGQSAAGCLQFYPTEFTGADDHEGFVEKMILGVTKNDASLTEDSHVERTAFR